MSATTIETADSPDLEDLFDSIAVAAAPGAAPIAEAPVAAAPTAGNGDSGELEQLFDEIAQAPTAADVPAVADAPAIGDARVVAEELTAASAAPQTEPVAAAAAPAASVIAEADETTPSGAGDRMINSVGHLTRQLHNTLAELGLDRSLQDATAAALPDARQRIAYVVKLTEDAAGKCLSAVERATPLQEGLAAEATALAGQWDSIFEGKSDVAAFKALAQSTRDYLHGVTTRTDETRSHLREVMMAQEFQDLTGQVLKKISELATTLESQLVMLLVENAPAEIKTEAVTLLNGPAIDGSAPNVVASQEQVDELLESLGF